MDGIIIILKTANIDGKRQELYRLALIQIMPAFVQKRNKKKTAFGAVFETLTLSADESLQRLLLLE